MQNPITGNVGVYLLKSPDGLFKIGHSGDVNKRVSTLSSALLGNLEIVDVIDVEDKARRVCVEKCLHALLFEYHVAREWYRLPDDLEAWKNAVNTIASEPSVYSFWRQISAQRSPALKRVKWHRMTRKYRGSRSKPQISSPTAVLQQIIPSETDGLRCPMRGLCLTREAHRKARQTLFDRITGF